MVSSTPTSAVFGVIPSVVMSCRPMIEPATEGKIVNPSVAGTVALG